MNADRKLTNPNGLGAIPGLKANIAPLIITPG